MEGVRKGKRGRGRRRRRSDLWREVVVVIARERGREGRSLVRVCIIFSFHFLF